MIEKMVLGAKNALEVVLTLKKDENVLVVTDKEKEEIGRAFLKASESLGAKTEIYILPEEKRPLEEIPLELLPLLEEKDVILNVFKGIAEETPFRIKLIKKEVSLKARVGHCPGITVEMMTEGPMTADYKRIAEDVKGLIEKFRDAKSVHIRAPAGTNIKLNIEDREFDTDVWIEKGKFGNLPAGEIWCAPVEDGANGLIVVDGSIGDVGQVTAPLKIEVEKGKIVEITSGNKDLEKRIKALVAVDEYGSVVGELGIGLNPRARLVGNLLEDEKAGGTAHIAFGNNLEMPGGKNPSKTHRDFLFYKPTMVVTYKDGRKRTVMVEGKVL
ncbi:MAG TPA: leucyl aminopeptidase [Thermoplasmata archaeon]|nr:leucyl aminopeptidase [Thermoplasmata archaeon]